MMQQAQKMQEDMASVQEELGQKQVEASVGGGKVVVTANAAGDIKAIKISPDVVDPEDVEMLEDLLLSGIKQALEQGKKVQTDEMSKVTADLGLPPGMGF